MSRVACAETSAVKAGHCLVPTTNPEGLQKAADALRSDDAAGLRKEICERWIYTTCLCFALDLPEPGQSGLTKVGGIDCHKLRMRTVRPAGVALSTSPKGFAASDLARKVCALNGPSETAAVTNPPQKVFARWLPCQSCHKVIQPLLAASCNPSLHPEPQDPAHIDEHYASLRSGMRGLFEALGTAA